MNHTISTYCLPGISKKRVVTTQNRLLFDLVLQATADVHDIPAEDVRLKTRQISVVEPRQIAMYILRTHYHFQLADIAYLMGGFNHTTVIAACKTVSNLMQTEPEYKKRVEAVLNIVT